MSLTNSFAEYKEEIQLIQAQNPVECELYSIIACIVRNIEAGKKTDISLRDVSSRRETSLSRRYISETGFPDFVVLSRDVKNSQILGAIEIKRIVVELDSHLEQLDGHVRHFMRVIYTNGLEWRFYRFNELKKSGELIWQISLGAIHNEKIVWNDDNSWKSLVQNIRTIDWTE